MHPTGIDNRIMGLKNIVNRYLKEKDIDVIDEEFGLNIFSKNLTAIDDKINMIVEEHEPKEKVRIEDKKGVISILHKTRKNFLIIILIPILLLNCINNINIIKVKLIRQKRRRQQIGNGIKVLTANNLLSRRPVLLAQVKAGNNS